MKRLLVTALASLAFLAPLSLDAHSEKENTVPADGAVLAASPTTIGMTFDRPMRVTMLRLKDAKGQEYEVSRTDGMAPVTEFRATPETLGDGEYEVEWRGLAEDGHPMQGSFSFTLAD
ncbi:MAG: copper resistance CopC family protein [Pseudomonadota bacterium]